MEKTQVTEIQVRIDCNGCVQKIKKALLSINGINDVYIDIPQQKLRIIGWADHEKIIKAIKKTRKIVSICLETEPSPATEQPSGGGARAPTPDPETVEPPTTTHVQECATPQTIWIKKERSDSRRATNCHNRPWTTQS
ncbi:heavy metal-associated domain, HMA containing protein [Tanacetum coccineum]